METSLEFKDFVSHFPVCVSQELFDFAQDVVFRTSRYIFTRREGKRQYGYCTHCRQESETAGFRHGEKSVCKSCGSVCTVKASGRSRKFMIDEAYFVYYEKSVLDPQTVTARGIYAIRDYREDYRAVDMEFEVKAMYLFAPKQTAMFERPWLWYSDTSGWYVGRGWQPRKTIGSLMGGSMAHKPCFTSYESILAAIEGTPLQYSTWEQYRGGDMVKFFDLATKYPCVEYLTKLGMRGLVDAKLNGDRTYNMVNWRAKNPLEVLKMSKQEMNELRAAEVTVDPWMLYVRHVAKKEGSNMSVADVARLSNDIPEGYQTYLKVAMRYASLGRLDAYFTKQLANPDAHLHYDTKRSLLVTWNDYIKDCVYLGLDISSDAVKFPKNLYRAHQNTIKQIKLRADELLAAKIAERVKSLRKMQFEALGFILRPAQGSQELIDEGKALHHCVGTYADRYAKGETDIFVLRRADKPDKPFYTMEIKQGIIVQCRGLKNCTPTEDVQVFIDMFVSQKLPTKKGPKVGIAV